MRYLDQIPELPAGATTVQLRHPVDFEAKEIRKWMDLRIKGEWRVKVLEGQEADTSTLVASKADQPDWRHREAGWGYIVRIHAPTRKLMPQTVAVLFADAKEAMLFKLTWG